MNQVQEVTEGDAYRGPMKLKKVRDYSGGNLLDLIAKVESIEELTQLRDQFILPSYQAGNFSTRTSKRIQKAVNVRHEELKNRLVVSPPRGGILVPNHVAKGSVLVGADGKPVR